MKRMPSFVVNSLLSAAAASCTVFCLTTGFDIQVNGFLIVIAALLSAMCFSLCYFHKKLLFLLIPGALLFAGVWYITDFFDPILPSFMQLLHDILTRFSNAYPNYSFVIPRAPEDGVRVSFTLLLSFAAFLLGAWMAWGVGYRSSLICIAGALPILLICVIINDTPPSAVPLVILISVWATVLLAKERQGEPSGMDAARVVVTAMAVLLVFSVIGIVYPKDDTRDQALPEVLQEFLEHMPGPIQRALDRNSKGVATQVIGADTDAVLDLTQQGIRDRSDTVMLQLSCTDTGALYLRGAAKDIYTGTSWESRDEATTVDSVYAHTSLGTSFGDSDQAAVQIKNYRDSATVLFEPYGYISCTSASDITSDLRINMPEDDYIIYFWPNVRSLDLTQTGVADESYDAYVNETCLDLPDGVGEELYELAISCGYDPELTTVQKIAWVAQFVRATGSYRLDVSCQPSNYDFATYFLETSQEGYCVHFATAAAVMYRALGIPSRYASGYRITVTEEGAVTDVTDQDTHAWAEVYLSGIGWIPVETTPGFSETLALPQVEVEQTAQQQEPEDVESTEDEGSPEEEAASEEETAPEETPEPEESSPEPSQEPESQNSGTDEQEETSGDSSSVSASVRTTVFGWLLRIILILLALVLLALAVIISRAAILRKKRRRGMEDSNRNAAAIVCWQYFEGLMRWGAEPDSNLEDLALKAKFSQHELTEEEFTPYRDKILETAENVRSSLRGLKRIRYDIYEGLKP